MWTYFRNFCVTDFIHMFVILFVNSTMACLGGASYKQEECDFVIMTTIKKTLTYEATKHSIFKTL